MTFVEAFEFMRTVKAFPRACSEQLPTLHLHDAERKATMYVKIGCFNGKFFGFPKKTAKTRGLQLRRLKDFLNCFFVLG